MTSADRLVRWGRWLSAVVVLLTACVEQQSAPVIGQPIPDFELPDLQGNVFRLSEHREKVVLINFWATWCPPCIDEMPSLEKLYRALNEKGLEIVAVSVDDSSDEIEAFRKELGLSFTVLQDKGARISHAYQTFKYPESYLVGRDGNLAWKVVGPRDWIAPDLMLDLVAFMKSDGVM
jgi:peroxiredoxin